MNSKMKFNPYEKLGRNSLKQQPRKQHNDINGRITNIEARLKNLELAVFENGDDDE